MTVALKGDRIFEDADYFVLKKKPLFGSTIWFQLFGKIYVQSKHSGVVTLVSPQEKQFWLSVVGELAMLKIGIDHDSFKEMMRSFSEAVLSRGNVRWSFFFQNGTPKDIAMRFA